MSKEKKKIVFWGARGHAKVLSEAVKYFGYDVIAIFDNNIASKSPLSGVPIFHGEEGFFRWLSGVNVKDSVVNCLVAIGGAHGKDRHQIQKFMEKNGIRSMSVIHPTAFFADGAVIGKGSQVLANASVCVDVNIGDACIINTSAIVDHESVLADGVHICPGSHIAGEVKIGSYSMIGTGATVLPGINIGSNVIVGAGSVVTSDIENDVIICGNPAKIYKKNV